MKKHLTILILIISILSIRFYPYINLKISRISDKYSKLSTVETTLLSSAKAKNDQTQYLAAGMVGLGEVVAGFTLAEVLITLLVIGVVSSLVIPGLIQDSQDAEFRAAWKKTYADLSQATMRITQDNGGSIKGLCKSDVNNCLRNLYAGYMNYSKLCDYGKNNGNCWLISVKTPSGSSSTDNEAAGMVLSNGSLLRFWLNTTDCTTTVGSPVIFTRCGGIMADTNGFKRPNVWGKDVFGVYVLENQLKPWGVQGDGDYCILNPLRGTGTGCAAVYLYQ